MKALIVYDSTYGNTEKIARAIGESLAPVGEVKVVRPAEVNQSELSSVDLLVVGSPTQGFRATKSVQSFIDNIPAGTLKGKNVAAFDTMIPEEAVGKGLRFIMKMDGYASPRMAQALEKKGGKVAAPPEGFSVKDKEGPLLEGELERAAAWAKGLTGNKK